jgi:hypothetical protein
MAWRTVLRFGHAGRATLGAMSYLVCFVADPAGDRHAEALREVARDVAGAGFVDDAEGGTDERTVGAYVRAERLDEPAVGELIARVAAVSARLGACVEVQHRERVLGHLRDGRADQRLAAALDDGSATA